MKTSIRRLAKCDEEFLKETIEKLLKAGLIQRSISKYASPVLIVRALGKEPRFCIDYRRLNQILKKNNYPIPIIDEIFDLLQGKQWYSSLDLKSSYWQIPIANQDRWKTAFTCKFGIYEWNVMPFGLQVAPGVFQLIADEICLEVDPGRKSMSAYLDDLSMGTNEFGEMEKLLHRLFESLRKHDLKIHPGKCQFFKKQLTLLGHQLEEQGIKPQGKIIKRIKESIRPQNKDEVRAFLGLVGYYQKFIKNFAEIAYSLTELIHKDSEWNWTKECEEAYVKLKQILTGQEILRHPDWKSKFILTTDASLVAMAGILSQEINGVQYPIQFASKKFSKVERLKWSIPEREYLAVIWAMKKFEYYLRGRKFLLITDHQSLQ